MRNGLEPSPSTDFTWLFLCTVLSEQKYWEQVTLRPHPGSLVPLRMSTQPLFPRYCLIKVRRRYSRNFNSCFGSFDRIRYRKMQNLTGSQSYRWTVFCSGSMFQNKGKLMQFWGLSDYLKIKFVPLLSELKCLVHYVRLLCSSHTPKYARFIEIKRCHSQ